MYDFHTPRTLHVEGLIAAVSSLHYATLSMHFLQPKYINLSSGLVSMSTIICLESTHLKLVLLSRRSLLTINISIAVLLSLTTTPSPMQ